MPATAGFFIADADYPHPQSTRNGSYLTVFCDYQLSLSPQPRYLQLHLAPILSEFLRLQDECNPLFILLRP